MIDGGKKMAKRFESKSWTWSARMLSFVIIFAAAPALGDARRTSIKRSLIQGIDKSSVLQFTLKYSRPQADIYGAASNDDAQAGRHLDIAISPSPAPPSILRFIPLLAELGVRSSLSEVDRDDAPINMHPSTLELTINILPMRQMKSDQGVWMRVPQFCSGVGCLREHILTRTMNSLLSKESAPNIATADSPNIATRTYLRAAITGNPIQLLLPLYMEEYIGDFVYSYYGTYEQVDFKRAVSSIDGRIQEIVVNYFSIEGQIRHIDCFISPRYALQNSVGISECISHALGKIGEGAHASNPFLIDGAGMPSLR